MVRYKRYKKRYGGTRTIKMKFQSFMDINTTPDSMQIITVSAGGEDLIKRLSPQFQAYKYYKIGSVSVKLVPAATLPVDPTGLSYEAGEPGVDPRDQLTPGLMRITNGEDIFENISGLSDAEQHAIYNNMLLDPRWFKWMLQSGVKRYASPRYWIIGQLHQDKWPGEFLNVPLYDQATSQYIGTARRHLLATKSTGGTISASEGTVVQESISHGLFQTGHTGRLGWLPTDALHSSGQPFIASPPEVEVMKIILPKAYKTKYYYRMFVTETVYFREPIVNFGIGSSAGVLRPLDVFHTASLSTPALPTSSVVFDEDGIEKMTGGNYGNN